MLKWAPSPLLPGIWVLLWQERVDWFRLTCSSSHSQIRLYKIDQCDNISLNYFTNTALDDTDLIMKSPKVNFLLIINYCCGSGVNFVRYVYFYIWFIKMYINIIYSNKKKSFNCLEGSHCLLDTTLTASHRLMTCGYIYCTWHCTAQRKMKPLEFRRSSYEGCLVKMLWHTEGIHLYSLLWKIKCLLCINFVIINWFFIFSYSLWSIIFESYCSCVLITHADTCTHTHTHKQTNTRIHHFLSCFPTIAHKCPKDAIDPHASTEVEMTDSGTKARTQ